MDYNYTQTQYNLKPNLLILTNNTHIPYKKKKKLCHKPHTHTHKQISTQITFRRNLLYVIQKESFLLLMWKDPQLKVTQSFPTMPIYKSQILFIDGQGISNYIFILRRIVFFYNKEKLFLSYQRNLIAKPKSKSIFEIISNH